MALSFLAFVFVASAKLGGGEPMVEKKRSLTGNAALSTMGVVVLGGTVGLLGGVGGGALFSFFSPSRGEKGEKGECGEAGPQGKTGSVGLTGRAGPRGERGPQGKTGSDGLAGADGNNAPHVDQEEEIHVDKPRTPSPQMERAVDLVKSMGLFGNFR